MDIYVLYPIQKILYLFSRIMAVCVDLWFHYCAFFFAVVNINF